MTKKEIQARLKYMPQSNLRHLFVHEFDVNQMCIELMDELPPTKLHSFMVRCFMSEFTIKELEKIINVKQFDTNAYHENSTKEDVEPKIFLFYRTDMWLSRDSMELTYVSDSLENGIAQCMKYKGMTEEQANSIRYLMQSQCSDDINNEWIVEEQKINTFCD